MSSSKTVVGHLLRSPLVLFAAGVAVGALGYKYRKEIVAVAAKTTEQGKDFLLNQKENLTDLLEEAQEEEETKGKA